MDIRYGQTILEEAYDESYEPTERDILEYCSTIGLDPHTEKDLLYIAREGTKAPLPPDWKPVEDRTTGNVYYFNFKTNESTWDHPCDDFYRKLLTEERRKKNRATESKKSTKRSVGPKKTAAKSESVISAPTGPLNPLNPVGGLGEGRAPLPSLGQLKKLPPLKVPPLKVGTLAPVQPPPASLGAPSLGPGPGLSNPTHPSITSSHPQQITTSHLQLNPLQHGLLVEGRGDRKGGSVDKAHKGGSAVGKRGGQREGEGGGGGGGGGGKRDALLGTVELGANLNISTQFEEEEEEEDSSSDIISGEFRSKLQEKLLNPNDLGIKSEEDINSSEEDNISEELMKLMHSSGEEGEGEGEGEGGEKASELERPPAPLGQPQHTGFSPTGRANAPPSPLLSPPIPSSLSPLPTTHGGMYGNRQPASTAYDGTIHSNREPVVTAANSRGLPTTIGSSITPPPGLKLKVNATSTSTAPGIYTHSQVTAQKVPSVIPAASSSGFSVAEIKSGGHGQVGVSSGEVKTATEKLKDTKHTQNLEKMKLEHEKAVEELRKEHLAEIERERETVKNEVESVRREGREGVESVKREGREEVESVKREGREEVERVRREGREEVERVRREGREEVERVKREVKEEVEKVRRKTEEERADEERKLRDQKVKNMSELKKMLKDEEEEEEARLVEEKEDSLRQLKLKVTTDKERGERLLREEAEKSQQTLKDQLAAVKSEEETRLRSVASQELDEFRAEAEREAEEEKEKVRKELQRQLQVFREEQEEKHNKEKAEVEESCREQLEALQHKQQLKVQSELEKKRQVDQERETAEQTHQQALSSLESEFAAALEMKRSELQEQHRTALEAVERELESTLTSVKIEHKRKVEKERERLKAEYDSLSTATREEQEEKVKQLKAELAMEEEKQRQQVQIQSEKLAELQSQHNLKHTELQQLQEDLEQETQQVASERMKLTEDQTQIKTAIERERETLTSLQTSRQSLECSLVELRKQCSSEENKLHKLQEEEGSVRRRGGSGRGGSGRRGRGGGDREANEQVTAERQERDNPLLAEGVNAFGDERLKSKDARIKSHDRQSEEDWSESGGTVGTMQLEELAPPTSTPHTHPPVLPTNESVKEMLEQNQRALLRVIAEEQSRNESLQRRRRETGLGGKRARSKGRGEGAEKGVHTKPKKKWPSHPPKPVKMDAFPTDTVKSKLKEEARALGELEEKLRSSRQLLSSKEQDLRQLHSLLNEGLPSDGEDGGRASEERREDSSLRSGRGSAVREKVSLSDRETPKRASRTGSTLRTPRARSRTDEDLRPTSSRTQQAAYQHVHESRPTISSLAGRREREEGSSHTRAGETVGRGRGTREPSRVLRLEMSESSSGGVAVSEPSVSQSDGSTTSTDEPSTIDEDQLDDQHEISRSLKMINNQLSQLMSRVDQGSTHHFNPPTLPMSPHYTHPPLSPSSPSQHATTRWAEPVVRVTLPLGHQPQPRRGGRDLSSPRQTSSAPSVRQSYRHGRSGDSHVTTGSTHFYPGDRSHEMMQQHQTDWLQEFHRSFPRRPLPLSAPLLTHSPSVPLAPYTIPHAQLVMDSDRNIHLVHM